MEIATGSTGGAAVDRTSSSHGESTAVAVGCPADSAMAGRADVCQGCPGRELCSQQAGQEDPDLAGIKLRMNACRRKILVVSGKGGVGKSSIAANLAIALARNGQKVGVCDLDICGPSIPKILQVEGQQVVNTQYGWTPLKSPHNGIKVMSIGSLLASDSAAVVWRGPRKSEMIKRFLKDTFWGRLDYLIFDTPPGTSDEHLTVVSALRAANLTGALIVATPQLLALDTVRKELTFCRKMGVDVLGLVENLSGFVCPCCEETYPLFDSGGVQRLAADTQTEFIGTVPIDPRLSACEETGGSLLETHPHSAASVAIMSVSQKVQEICNS